MLCVCVCVCEMLIYVSVKAHIMIYVMMCIICPQVVFFIALLVCGFFARVCTGAWLRSILILVLLLMTVAVKLKDRLALSVLNCQFSVQPEADCWWVVRQLIPSQLWRLKAVFVKLCLLVHSFAVLFWLYFWFRCQCYINIWTECESNQNMSHGWWDMVDNLYLKSYTKPWGWDYELRFRVCVCIIHTHTCNKM